MLSRHRRYFALLTFLLLAAPLIVGIVRPDSPELILKEGRLLASAPTPPRSIEALTAFPGEVDAYLKDHFGLRQTMIHTHRDLSHPVLYGNEQVLVGRDGRMFYLGRDMVRQSAGLVLRDRKVADSADMLAEMRDALARRGIGLLVAVAPNSSTIYQDDLPLWAQSQGRKTEYDLLLADLAARGVKSVDLRPVMEKARSDAEAYLLHDTHWTARSAVLAFNAIAEAGGHPDWALEPGSSVGPPFERRGGDVARIMGVEDEVT
jgi:alginate O-acetyltransferase complex protein AlgJ